MLEIPLTARPGPVVVEVGIQVRAGAIEARLDSPSGVVDSLAIAAAPLGTPAQIGLEAARLAPGSRLVIVGRTRGEAPTVVHLGPVRVTALDDRTVQDPHAGDALLAVYDLRRCPPGLSFAAFLIDAEKARLAAGLSVIDVILLHGGPGRDADLPAEYRRVFPEPLREEWVASLLPGLTELLPSVRYVHHRHDRDAVLREALASSRAFPTSVLPEAGSSPPILRSFEAATNPSAPRLSAPSGALNRVGQWLGQVASSHPITILQPRAEGYVPEMNSAVAVWAEAAQRMAGTVIVAPDPRRPSLPAPEGPWVEMPWHDVASTQALYELADLTIAAYGEGAIPLMLSTAPYALWVLSDDRVPAMSADTLRIMNLAPGGTPRPSAHRQTVHHGRPTVDALTALAASSRLS